MNLALFDLDNTLIAGDSDVEWPRYLIAQGVLEASQYAERSAMFYQQYQDGTLNMPEFLAFQLAPLARFSRTQLDAWHADYLQQHIMPLISDRARTQVRQHQDAGDVVLVITATNRFITAPIVREFGIEHLIATELEEIDGQFTGQSCGVPSFQHGKILRLDAWLAERGERLSDYEKTWFYSDSHNDMPLMSMVSHPVAVDPDPRLRAHAERAGWPIISLREAHDHVA